MSTSTLAGCPTSRVGWKLYSYNLPMGGVVLGEQLSRVELRERVARLLAHPDPDTTLFVAALSFAGCLPATEATAALGTRSHVLAQRITGLDGALGT